MAASTTSSPALRAAFAGMVDYAGLFPPAQLGIEAALAEYAAARGGPHAWMLARFIVPENHMERLLEIAPPQLPLSVIVAPAGDSRAWFAAVRSSLQRIAAHRAAGVSIESLELQLPRLLSLRETYDAAIGQYSAAAAQNGLHDLPSYVELPRDERQPGLLPGALAAMKRHRLRAKLRCGGATASWVPSVYEVAAFVRAAGEEDVAFKATAGLHHPVRGYNEQSGFMMHGFLNLLTAAALARQCADEDAVIAAIEDEDPADFRFGEEGLRWRDRAIALDVLREARAKSFNAYGSCSFSEPVDDLIALGYLS